MSILSIDTNVLLAAVDVGNAQNKRASAWLTELNTNEDVAISEFVLFELYGLLRNPAVLRKPISANAAVNLCQAFRVHPRWQLLGFPEASRNFHNELWPLFANEQFPRRRIYDLRLARSLTAQGVSDFATVNLKDFFDVGFTRVFNPLVA